MNRILAFSLSLLATVCAAEIRMSGETNHPENSMFKPGDPIRLEFEVSGLTPADKLSLEINIVDQNDKTIRKTSIPLNPGADGKWKQSIPAPNRNYGFYRARVKLSNGVTTPKTGSRPAGSIPYAILPDPASAPLYPQSETFFGIHGQSAGMIPWMGARWMSGGVSLNPQPSERARRETAQKAWKTYTYVTLATPFRYQYPSQEELKKHTDGKIFTDAAGEKLFRNFYQELAAKGRLQKYGNDFMRYQPMWEPDLYFTDDEILKLHKVAWEGIHAGDPDARILGPCFSNITSGLVERHKRLFEKGLLRYIDEFTIHPYLQYPVEQNGLVENIRALRKLVRQYSGGKEIRLRANESGYSAISTVEQELIQMYGQVRGSLILLGEGFASNEPFYGYDHSELGTGDYGLCYNLDTPKRIWAPKRVAPRPVFPALAAASRILEGHRSTGPIEYLGDTVLGYSYADRNDHCVIALWDFGGNMTEVELPVGRAEIVVADMMGNRKTIKTADGLLRLKLSEAPTYIIGVDPKLWGRNVEKKILTDAESLRGTVGSTILLTGKTRSAGELQLIFPRSMNLKPVTQKLDPNGKFTFSIPIPVSLQNGKYPLTLKLLDRGRLSAATGILLEVMPPIRVSEIHPSFERGEPGIAVTLSNPSEIPLGGVIETRITGYPEARKKVPFQLKPGETGVRKIIFHDLDLNPFRVVTTQVRFRLDSGYTFERSEKLNYLSASYLPGVGINGDFSQWKNPQRYPVDPTPIRSIHYHSGKEDLHAEIAFGWNEQYLLFDVSVTDDIHLQPFTGWKIWDGDSLQFGFARKRTTQGSSNEFGDQYDLAFSEINFALTSKGAEADRTFSFDKARFPSGAVSGTELPRKITATRQTDGKTILHYQIAVPWKLLNLEKALPGMTVHWAGMVNDRDADSRQQKDVSALGIFQLKQAPPSHFGTIVLDR